VVLATIGSVAALNGWFGGGREIPTDTFTRGLVGYWAFEEGSGQTASDTSNYSNNGTLGANSTPSTDDPSWIAGKVGGALEFDGVDDKVTIPHSSSLNISNALTVSAWIKYDSIGAQSNVIVDKRPRNNLKGWSLSTNDVTGGRGFYLQLLAPSCGGSPGATDQNVILTNRWYYVVVTYDGSNIKTYVNGILGAATACSGTISVDSSDVWIANNEANPTQFTDGIIDEVRIYNRALSAEEVRYHYNRGGPVGHWKFDEGEGNTAYDSTDNNNDGTLTLAPSGNTATSSAWVAGKYGSAFSFDGTDDYFSISDDSVLDITDAITISAWVKPITISGNKWFAAKTITYELGFSGSKIDCSLRINNVWATNITGKTTPQAGEWQHISCTYDGNFAIVYLNGKEDAKVYKNGSITANDNSLFIGSTSAANNFYDGLVDDVRIYNYARTPEQVQLDYNAGLSTHFK
jgi:hypothetical protein